MHSFEELLNKDIKNLIRLSSMKLARACNDPSSERKDMEQELYMELFKRFKEFNEEKSSFKTFVRHVINDGRQLLVVAGKNQAYERCQSFVGFIAG
jgi:DNA-directed RNA polymerase specialized sigma24 family protein